MIKEIMIVSYSEKFFQLFQHIAVYYKIKYKLSSTHLHENKNNTWDKLLSKNLKFLKEIEAQMYNCYYCPRSYLEGHLRNLMVLSLGE